MYFRMLESFLSVDSCFQKRILICLVRFIVKTRLCIKNARKRNSHIIFLLIAMYCIHELFKQVSYFFYTVLSFVNYTINLKQRKQKQLRYNAYFIMLSKELSMVLLVYFYTNNNNELILQPFEPQVGFSNINKF